MENTLFLGFKLFESIATSYLVMQECIWLHNKPPNCKDEVKSNFLCLLLVACKATHDIEARMQRQRRDAWNF